MFAPGSSIARVALLTFISALFAPSTEAKEWNFKSGAPIGIGLSAGVTQNADTDLVAAPSSASSDFGQFFGFEPFLDFGNFLIRLSGEIHFTPSVSSRGLENSRHFSDNGDVSSYQYGIDLQLAPYVSENERSRAYIKLGLGRAIVEGENSRRYDTGGVYAEEFEGKGRELLASVGYEFFLVQNYSMQLESGFRQLEFDQLTYRSSGTDLTGVAKNKGDYLVDANGKNKRLNQSGWYFSVGLNLHF